MVAAASRIRRWRGTDSTVARSMPGSSRPAQIDTLARAGAALRIASSVLVEATSRQRRTHARRRYGSLIEVAVGAVGLCAIATILADAPQVNVAFAGAAWAAAALPLGSSIFRAVVKSLGEVDDMAAVAHARTVVAQAGRLVRTLETSPEVMDYHPFIESLLLDVEHAAAALPGREHRQNMDLGGHARRHLRIKPINDRVAVTTSAGLSLIAHLIDVSISGAAIAGDIPDVRVGDEIHVGSRAATVVRTLAHGLACEFVEPLPPIDFDPDLVL